MWSNEIGHAKERKKSSVQQNPKTIRSHTSNPESATVQITRIFHSFTRQNKPKDLHPTVSNKSLLKKTETPYSPTFPHSYR